MATFLMLDIMGNIQSIAMQNFMVGGISMTIKNYEVVIKTLGPVHIGSGQVMKKQDYIYDFYNSKVYMINGKTS